MTLRNNLFAVSISSFISYFARAVASFPRNYSYLSGDRCHAGGTRKHVVGNQEKLKKGVGRYRETGKGRVVNRRKGDKIYSVV